MKEQPLYTILCILTFSLMVGSFFASTYIGWKSGGVLLLAALISGAAFIVHAYYAEKSDAKN